MKKLFQTAAEPEAAIKLEMEDIASGIQVTLDTARFGLSPRLSGFDHGVDIVQTRRRVEASDRDLRLRGEVEDQRLEETSAAAAERVAASRCRRGRRNDEPAVRTSVRSPWATACRN